MTELVSALVIAAFGRHMVVRTSGGLTLRARPFGRALEVVCGDEVRCRIDAHHAEVHVLEVLRRRNALWRANSRGGAEPVVANLTRLLVVLAPLPEPDPFIIDRYLAAATAAEVPATPIVNKCDLPLGATLALELDAYLAAGFAAIHCSAVSGAGMEELMDLLDAGTRAALVGQSGVGKSSLVRRLLPEAEVAIGELVREEAGRHTTTAARLFHLPRGAELIDSPGVRDFAPAVSALDERTLGFPEVARLAAGCRFNDCLHLREPGCAVRRAAEDGTWHPRRYESYRRLRRLRARLGTTRGR